MAAKIEGSCDEKFRRVRETFAANFDSGSEIGAALAVTLDGKPMERVALASGSDLGDELCEGGVGAVVSQDDAHLAAPNPERERRLEHRVQAGMKRGLVEHRAPHAIECPGKADPARFLADFDLGAIGDPSPLIGEEDRV